MKKKVASDSFSQSILENNERSKEIVKILQSYRIQKGLALKDKIIKEEVLNLYGELEIIEHCNNKLQEMRFHIN